ncbi:hypothetical protein, partial [Mycobacterium tuberculosis]
RSRSSGGYLLDEPPDMTPSFPRTGVSGHAGAVHYNISQLHEPMYIQEGSAADMLDRSRGQLYRLYLASR